MTKANVKGAIVPVALTPEQRVALKTLSARTRVPQQAYLREAIVDVLAKYGREAAK